MSTPEPRSLMWGSTSCAPYMYPRRFVSTTRRCASMGTSSKRPSASSTAPLNHTSIPEVRHGPPRQLLDRPPVRHVRRPRERPSSPRLALGGDLQQRLLPAGGEHHGGAPLREQPRRRASDPTGSARYHHDRTLDPASHASPSHEPTRQPAPEKPRRSDPYPRSRKLLRGEAKRDEAPAQTGAGASFTRGCTATPR